MFTGIVEALGRVSEIIENGTNKTFWISSPLSQFLKVDQSLSHNGVCLTVEEIKNDFHRVTAIKETLEKSNLNNWQLQGPVNLERCLPLNGRLDGHLVQGHVDGKGTLLELTDLNGSWQLVFSYPAQQAALVIEKGSIAVNGISLTIFNVTANSFSVGIIPYTYDHTNISELKVGDEVNLEFDMIGKYVQRSLILAG